MFQLSVSIPRSLPLLLACLAMPTMARANVMLNDVTYAQAYSNGMATGQSEAGTNTPCCEIIYMSQGGLSAAPSYINTAQQDLSINLAAGSYTFSGLFATNYTTNYGNISLFFDGAGLPGITVQAATTDSLSSAPAYSADGGTTLGLVSPWWVSGANSLSYDNGTSTATLSNFILASSSLLSSIGAPEVGSSSLPYDGTYNYGTQFTLTVTDDAAAAAVPEPAGLLLFSTAFASLMLLRNRSRRSMA